jgi:GNAT superfamily N-acetyltransferase
MIILADKADLDKIYSIQKQLALDFDDFYWVTKKWVKGQIKLEQCYVIKEDDIIKGVMCISWYGEVVQIQTLIVDEQYRNQGIGSCLVEFAKDFWRKRTEMVLHVGSFFEYGIYDFYVKHGFQEESIKVYRDHKYHEFVLKDRD